MTTRGLMISLSLTMTLSHTYGQTLFGSRATALGDIGALVADTRGFSSNIAGIVGMRDWEFTTSTYASKSTSGFVFHGLTFGKRFLENEAVAVQYAPGSLLEFLVPSGVAINTGDSVISLDQRVSYSEDFSFGYAHRFSDAFSVGIGGKIRREKIADTEYRVIPSVEINTSEYSSTTLLGDLSILWRPVPSVVIAGAGRNIFALRGNQLPDEFGEFILPANRAFELSAKLGLGSAFSVAGRGSTCGDGAVGAEVIFPGLNVSLRGGLYVDKEESPFVHAFAVGAGWAYEFLEIDFSYLGLVRQSSRSGSLTVSGFDASRINSLALNSYTENRLALSLKAIFGNVRESLARIQSVDILSAIYPSSYELLAFRPIGKVMVKNVSDKPVQAKVSFYIEKYMDAPTESPSVYMLPGEEKEIPFNAVLNDQIRSVNKLTVREGNVYVSATPAEEYDDRFQAKVLIHGRNDWDGDVNTLRHFVTPDDPDILRYTRDILLQFKDTLASVPRELEQLVKARLLFNAFAGKIVYVGDPKKSSDYVQYPSETLVLKSGDCDDMTACFSSLISSIGISTAFIDVVPPQHPEKSHIYMMFDTGLAPKFGPKVSDNPKRYVVRKNSRGDETIWLPIETTVITKGFETAWSTGAQEYLEDVEINLGLIKGWVKIVDVN